jgi:hypothetical protein
LFVCAVIIYFLFLCQILIVFAFHRRKWRGIYIISHLPRFRLKDNSMLAFIMQYTLHHSDENIMD